MVHCKMMIKTYSLAVMVAATSSRATAFSKLSTTIQRVWVRPLPSYRRRNLKSICTSPTRLNRDVRNKFGLYRQHVRLNICNDDVPDIDVEDHGVQASRQAIKVLAQKNRTWLRLKDIVELCSKFSEDQKTIADIGCDHGLLSIALASSGNYESVIGVDVSHRALEGGALKFHEKVKAILTRPAEDQNDVKNDIIVDELIPLQFREGDGLLPLKPGEADAVCIAGMGVKTMISILNSSVPGSVPEQKCVDYIRCDNLFLQPQKSRPRHLMKLYRALQNEGWILRDERISYIKSRWYLTAAFRRKSATSSLEHCNLLPGAFLLKEAVTKEKYMRYVNYHLKWLEQDFKMKGSLHRDDEIWKSHFKCK